MYFILTPQGDQITAEPIDEEDVERWLNNGLYGREEVFLDDSQGHLYRITRITDLTNDPK